MLVLLASSADAQRTNAIDLMVGEVFSRSPLGEVASHVGHYGVLGGGYEVHLVKPSEQGAEWTGAVIGDRYLTDPPWRAEAPEFS